MSVGKRKHLLTLQRLQPSVDAEYGDAGPAVWVVVAEVWAKRTDMLRETAEALAGGALLATAQVRFDIRKRDVDPAWRIVDRAGVVYDIKAVGPGNDNSEMSVLAISGANNG